MAGGELANPLGNYVDEQLLIWDDFGSLVK
jgi:hypothetical protein